MPKKKNVPPLLGQMYGFVKNWHDSATFESGQKEVLTPNLEEGNIITSIMVDSVLDHKVIIDLDLPAQLIPSTTPGHFHLYVDHIIPRDKYLNLLDALAEAGLVEPGYAAASRARGYSAVRLPWIKKEVSETSVITFDDIGFAIFGEMD